MTSTSREDRFEGLSYSEIRAMRDREEAEKRAAEIAFVPTVGDGANHTVYTDRYACTVIAVSRNGKRCTLQEDKATLLNGVDSGEPDAMTFEPGGYVGHFHGRQRYAYERDPNGDTYEVSRRVLKDGSVIWKRVGQPTASPGGYVRFEERSRYHDFNF